jgi:hypothetical protein
MSLAGISPTALALLISEVEAAVDGHIGFDTKTGGFETGIRTGQAWYDDGTRKTKPVNIYLPVINVVDYKIQVSNLSTSGAGYFAIINPQDVAINNFQRELEIVPLQAVTYSSFAGVLDFGLNPPIVKVDINQGFILQSLSEQLFNPSGDNKTFVALHGFWHSVYTQANALQPATLPPIPPVVYVNGSPVNPSGYTINYVEGTVTFTSTQAGNTISADYAYQIPDVVTSATVKQLVYELERRQVRKLGLYTGLQKIRSGDQEISGPTRPMQEMVGGLTQEAADILDGAFGNMIGVG